MAYSQVRPHSVPDGLQSGEATLSTRWLTVRSGHTQYQMAYSEVRTHSVPDGLQSGEATLSTRWLTVR